MQVQYSCLPVMNGVILEENLFEKGFQTFWYIHNHTHISR